MLTQKKNPRNLKHDENTKSKKNKNRKRSG